MFDGSTASHGRRTGVEHLHLDLARVGDVGDEADLRVVAAVLGLEVAVDDAVAGLAGLLQRVAEVRVGLLALARLVGDDLRVALDFEGDVAELAITLLELELTWVEKIGEVGGRLAGEGARGLCAGRDRSGARR